MLGGPPFHGFYPVYPPMFANANVGERVPLVNRQVPTVAAGVWNLPIHYSVIMFAFLCTFGERYPLARSGTLSFFDSGSLTCLLFAAMARSLYMVFALYGSLGFLIFLIAWLAQGSLLFLIHGSLNRVAIHK